MTILCGRYCRASSRSEQGAGIRPSRTRRKRSFNGHRKRGDPGHRGWAATAWRGIPSCCQDLFRGGSITFCFRKPCSNVAKTPPHPLYQVPPVPRRAPFGSDLILQEFVPPGSVSVRRVALCERTDGSYIPRGWLIFAVFCSIYKSPSRAPHYLFEI